MGRRRTHPTNAARQKAYRDRKRAAVRAKLILKLVGRPEWVPMYEAEYAHLSMLRLRKLVARKLKSRWRVRPSLRDEFEYRNAYFLDSEEPHSPESD